jgi:hypothetical protein
MGRRKRLNVVGIVSNDSGNVCRPIIFLHKVEWVSITRGLEEHLCGEEF